jgi:hypothetical protein|tara:strand:- start:2313 stop:2543 length:231 start_codon:yes stop_codon:yes gene_type:complete
MFNNPARQLYLNMDIDKLEEPQKEPTSGLLSPRKPMTNISDNAINKPAFRVAQHMKTLRKQREMLKNGDRANRTLA